MNFVDFGHARVLGTTSAGGLVVSPFDGATSVPTTTRVSATFDEIVTSATIALTDSTGKAVNGSTSCNSPCTMATFAPSAKLKPKTTYTAVAKGSNSAGSANRTWRFTTGK